MRLTAALLLGLAASASAAPTYTREGGVSLTSAVIQGVAGAFAGPQRVFYIRGSTEVFSATTPDGVTFTEEAGVRLSSLTVPAVDIHLSSITGLSVIPITGGWRMFYSVIGTTGAYRIYSATSADGLGWANDTGTVVNVAGGTTFAGYPSAVQLTSGDFRLYYIQNSIAGNQAANHNIYTQLSTNQGRNWAAASVALAAQAGEVSAHKLTDGKVRLYYTAPLTGGTSNTVVASALSTNVNGTSFSAETGVRFSTTSVVMSPFVTATTDTFRRRMYFHYIPPNISTGDAYAATANAPDPLLLSPSTVLRSNPANTFTVTGSIFDPTATVVFRRSGNPDITGAGVTSADDQTLSATFNTQNQEAGFWDVIVTNGNGLTGTLTNGLYIDFPGGSVLLVDNLFRPRDGTRVRSDVTIYNAGHITAKLYTVDGRFISTLYDADAGVGTTSFYWNGRTDGGAVVASGVYLLRVTGPKLDQVSKIVVIK